MTYMADSLSLRADPSLVLENARSLLVVGKAYDTHTPVEPGPSEGRISRYAWGDDYHAVVRDALKRIGDRVRREFPNVWTRVAVDSAPIMERDYAHLAGLGWFGKNTLLLNPRLGSWFFIGIMLLDADVAYDAPFATDHCGTCTRCLDACPTDAFDAPYQLDPRKCISYLTIEHKETLPIDRRPDLGPWVYGCDICQEVCPWNERSNRRPASHAEPFQPRFGNNPVSLAELLLLDDDLFAERFAGSAMLRLDRVRMIRNAVIAGVNQRAENLIPRLGKLRTDRSAELRELADWALTALELPLTSLDPPGLTPENS
jgi:epoxyqueuosine reductase